jgi:predicted transcriptional regulator
VGSPFGLSLRFCAAVDLKTPKTQTNHLYYIEFMSVTFSVRTEEETRDQIDKIAESLDRNRNWVINEAIRNYLELHSWQLQKIQRGLEDVKAGRTTSHEQVFARMEGRQKAQAGK